MKKIVFILIMFVITSAAVHLMTNSEEAAEISNSGTEKIIEVKEQIRNDHVNVGRKTMPKDHDKEHIVCKDCHDCEYPTREHPCLAACPRTDVSVYHSPDEAPDIIVLDNLSDRYGSVVFTHKIHAEMSEMSDGCVGCHHYNTTGPVLKCVRCHEEDRNRKDLSKPDLEAAFHRQCMTCHRQWARTTDCNSCHLPKGREGVKKMEEEISKAKSFVHPPVPEPDRVIYKTSYKEGRVVTFYHNEHTDLFGITCVSCHRNENCIRCHDINLSQVHTENYVGKKKSFEQHHKPCSSCHDNNNCGKCHYDKTLEPFDHYITTGWKLNKYHDDLACTKCHDPKFEKKPAKNCKSCHSNFENGKFNHKKTGLHLSDMHIDLDCTDCHISSDFKDRFSCKDCHDDKNYPKHMPGKKMK